MEGIPQEYILQRQTALELQLNIEAEENGEAPTKKLRSAEEIIASQQSAPPPPQTTQTSSTGTIYAPPTIYIKPQPSASSMHAAPSQPPPPQQPPPPPPSQQPPPPPPFSPTSQPVGYGSMPYPYPPPFSFPPPFPAQFGIPAGYFPPPNFQMGIPRPGMFPPFPSVPPVVPPVVPPAASPVLSPSTAEAPTLTVAPASTSLSPLTVQQSSGTQGDSKASFKLVFDDPEYSMVSIYMFSSFPILTDSIGGEASNACAL